MSHIDPLPSVSVFSKNSCTNFPALVKTWMRSFHPIAHVDEVRHEADTVDGIAEVLVGRRLRVVRTAGAAELVPGRVARWLAIRAPITLHRPGRLGIEDGDPLVSVAIRDVKLVRVDVDVEVRGPLDVDQVAIACRSPGFPDLKEERPVGREL
jgi:hypothetical protein